MIENEKKIPVSQTDNRNDISEYRPNEFNTTDLEHFLYSILLNDDTINKKLHDLCAFKMDEDEKIDLTKLGILNYLESFMENIVYKDDDYRIFINNINDVAKKIKIDFVNHLNHVIQSNLYSL